MATAVRSDHRVAVVLIPIIFYEVRTWLFLFRGAMLVLYRLLSSVCVICLSVRQMLVAAGISMVPMYYINGKSERECATLIATLTAHQ